MRVHKVWRQFLLRCRRFWCLRAPPATCWSFLWKRGWFLHRAAAACAGRSLPLRCLLWPDPRRLRERCASSRRRSEEHTSELQSQSNLVFRLLLEKKKKKKVDILYLKKYYICGSRHVCVQ